MTDLATELAHFTGTEQWHRHALNRKVTYTDGVKYFAEKAGAYWLLDIFATELVPHCAKEGFLGIKIVVPGNAGCTIIADDGNHKIVWSRKVDYTDCPEGTWAFFMAPGGPGDTFVIMLPSEY